VLSLAKKFSTAAVEDACAAALEMGVHEYRFVRRYLEHGPQLSLRQVDPLIRELVHYRDLINHRTKDNRNEPDCRSAIRREGGRPPCISVIAHATLYFSH